MRVMKSILLATAVLGLCTTANADSIIESWQCELMEGKTTDDVQAVNSRWLKWARENVSEEITSVVGTTIVGDITIFIYIDTYPDLAAWAAAKKAFDEFDPMFEDVSQCRQNRLWKIEETK